VSSSNWVRLSKIRGCGQVAAVYNFEGNFDEISNKYFASRQLERKYISQIVSSWKERLKVRLYGFVFGRKGQIRSGARRE
jgi:hypothetical protein